METVFDSNPSNYECKSELSNCCFGIGIVYLAKHVPSQQFVAVKKFQMDKAKEESNLIREEILTMRQFDCEHVLSLYTAFVKNSDVYVISPLMCYNSCRDAMNSYFTTGFPEIIVCLILRDVLLGLEYIHLKGYIHRSIRASHILINQTKAVLCGFREPVTLITNGQRTQRLFDLPPNSMKSLNWLAPEVLEQNLAGYTEKSDIYSIGITTCELANGLEPFANMPTTFMLTEKMRGNQPVLFDCSTCPDEIFAPTGSTSDIDNNFALQTHQIYRERKLSDHFHKFAEICMERYPDDRPNIVELQNHPLFKQAKRTTLAENFSSTGIDKYNCTKLSSDEDISLSCEMADMSIGGFFEWDF